jgi:hypothetical protein
MSLGADMLLTQSCPAFEEMTRAVRNDAYECYRLLDNPALYGSVGSDLVGLYLRMPQLADTKLFWISRG